MITRKFALQIKSGGGTSLLNYKIENLAQVDALPYSYTIYQKILMKLYAIKNKKLDRIALYEYEKRMQNVFQRSGLFLCQNGYLPLHRRNSEKRNICVNGYYQSEKFFSRYREDIIRIFTPNLPVMEMNQQLIKEITDNKQSVCVDFRLGDYMNNPLHGVCTMDYYRRSMQRMTELLSAPTFYLFSTDVGIVREATKDWGFNIVIENGDSPDYEKLRLMSACSHFIITNSTYDWWAQYLCTYNKKIVVAPSRWFGLPCPCDIYQSNWILIDP